MMKNWQVVFLMLCGLVVPGAAHAEIHALIMTIGDYQGGIPKLKGVIRDVESARSIARLLGAKDENILQFNDGQLNLKGMQRAFDELDRRVMPGDKVFIYYSGHGTRQRVSDPDERCAESLLSVDGQGLIDAEMETRLKKMSERTQKIIAMFDSCHSGGVATRALNDPMYTPKFWSKGGESTCNKPVNVLTRGIKLATESIGSGGKNYVYIAAAKDNEVSLDQAGKGGMATTAWLECLSGDAKDSDGSGGLTVEEIQVCAQQKIDVQMKNSKGFLPQHINIIGNPKLVMTLTPMQSEMQQEAVVQAEPVIPLTPVVTPANVVQPTPVIQSVPAVKPEPVVKPDPVVQPEPAIQPAVASGAPATLMDIFNGRDDRRTVEIIPVKNKLKIGKDKFSFSVRSSTAGYLYLLMVGSDGKTFDLLFPNKLDGNNYIQAEQLVKFPRPNWEVIAQGPAGKDRILVIVADAPRDLSRLPVTNAGPFSVASVTQVATRGIQLVTSTPSVTLQKECSSARTRTLAVIQACSDAYGAALAEIEETE